MSDPRSGLFSKDALQVPLAGVSIDAEISSFCARVVVAQRYVNRELHPIEAVYVFPLDEGAAVCGFEAIIDNTLVVGEVNEREDAFRAYDDAMAKGDGAFLLDQERPDVFQASVGNLPPGKEVLLKLTYVTELTVAGKGLRFSIPATVSPRYAPQEDRVGVGRPDSETLNPPVGWRVPYGLDLSVTLAMGGAISRVESPSHPASVTMNGSAAAVTLAQRDAALDRDFILSVECEGLEVPRAWIESGDGGERALALAFVPSFDRSSGPCDVTFLVDRSGSMDGDSIGEVRNALQLCLRSMIPGCAFNIVGFGTTFQALFETSEPYGERSLQTASAHVEQLAADLGGTEILPALQFALKQPAHGTLARQIVVLTDGEVTNTDAVIELARRHASHARIFTFGIGAGPSHHLVKGLARAGGGSAEFIHPGERIEPKVVRQFERILSPALTNLRLDWGGLNVTQAPSALPPVFAGDRLIAYGLVNDAVGGIARARLEGHAPSGPVSFAIDVNPSAAVPGSTIATLAARARLRELEESPDWLSVRGSRQASRRERGVVREIVALSTRYGVISRETSFVAVERRETPVIGDIQLRRVPIALTAGWGALNRPAPPIRPGMAGGLRPAMAAPPPPMPMAHMESRAGAPRMASQLTSLGRSLRDTLLPAKSSKPLPAGRPQPDQKAAPAGMHALVSLQRADGAWDLNARFARALGQDLGALEAGVSHAIGDRTEIRRAWATALALVWLEEHAKDAAGEWHMLAMKAQRWLDDVQAMPAGSGSWADAAARLLMAQSV